MGVPHLLIQFVLVQKLFVCPVAGHPAVLNDEDLVGVGDGRQAVGNDNHCFTLYQPGDSLLDGGFIPVIATVGMDDLGQAYNVNADTAAAQIAIALKAEKLVSMTDIAGLLRDKDDESTLIPEVEVSEIEGYKSAGIIAGGMIPKIGGMADAIYQGVHEAVIIDGRVPHSILLELFSNRGSGTRFYRRSHRE